MRYLLIFFLSSLFCFSQKTKEEAIDSIDFYIKYADIQKLNNNYKLAISYSQKAIKYAEKSKDLSGQAKGLGNLGSIFLDLKKYNDAKESLTKSINILKQLPVSSSLAINYYKMGLCYMNIEDYTTAEEYFNKSKEIYDNLKIDNSDLLNLQIGILYKKRGKIEEASSLFNSIISRSSANENQSTKAEALYNLGTIELKNGRNNLAINYLNRAMSLTKKNSLDQRIKIYNSLSSAYDKLMNIDKAYFFLKKHNQLKDSLASLNSKRLGAEDYYSFKESERMDVFEQMSKENEAQQKTNKFAKLISILAIALISILSLLSLSLYKNNIIRSQSNQLLKEKNLELQIAKEKAEKASQARAEFLSTVSHELRTPLNAINGITHLLLEENPKPNQLHYLNSLKFSGNYLLTFINEILEINRIEANSVEIEYINFDIKKQLVDIQNSLKELATNNNNVFIVEIDENIPNHLISDPTKLSQIFMNLINNALKFTKNGEVKVIAKEVSRDEKSSTLNFQIIDTGIGIAKEKQSTIFDSFSQGSIEINRKYGGTGLGLAIVKKLVDMLGGTITLESELGIGTVFTFEVKMEHGCDNTEEILETKKQSEYSDEILKGKHVLIVEDNKINQMITKKMIENKGMTSRIIDNGEIAIEIIKNDNIFDLVLMDVHLPGINGTIATQQIREFDIKTPIIALTAISLNENREMLLSFGMTDVITKPFEPETFYKVIAQTLEETSNF